MRVFQVRHGETGAILWTGSAAGELQALDAMAHEAGYYDHSDLPESIRLGGLSVESLAFQNAASVTAERRVQAGRAGQTVQRSGSATRNDSRSTG